MSSSPPHVGCTTPIAMGGPGRRYVPLGSSFSRSANQSVPPHHRHRGAATRPESISTSLCPRERSCAVCTRRWRNSFVSRESTGALLRTRCHHVRPALASATCSATMTPSRSISVYNSPRSRAVGNRSTGTNVEQALHQARSRSTSSSVPIHS